MPKKTSASVAERLPIPVELIVRRIYLIRGQKVMLDSGLAELYQVTTKVLNQAIKRNRARFPDDFMFQLSPEEAGAMRSQFVTASRRNIRSRPYAFTEHGVAMLSAVLNSERAVKRFLAARVEKLEAAQKKHGSIIGIIAEEIEEMKRLPEPAKRPIGFKTNP